MNIAFPALFVFLLALPGIILRYSYREWLWKTPVYPLPIGEAVPKSAFSAAVLNFLWCLLAAAWGYRINYGDVLILLTGGFGLPPALLADRLAAITRHPLAITAYFGSLYAAAAALGLAGRGLVRRLGLDLRFKSLRFDNFWLYALNAEIPRFYEYRAKYAEMLGISEQALGDQEVIVIVSCIVNHGARPFVYFGFPLDHSFDRSGNLDKIVVESVSYEELRSPIADGSPAISETSAANTNERFSIAADIFVFNACDIHNIAVEYIFASSSAEEENSEQIVIE